jgi:hypothetical protein
MQEVLGSIIGQNTGYSEVFLGFSQSLYTTGELVRQLLYERFLPIHFQLIIYLSGDQSFWLQIQRSWVQFPALPDFLRSGVSGTGSTQPREDN